MPGPVYLCSQEVQVPPFVLNGMNSLDIVRPGRRWRSLAADRQVSGRGHCAHERDTKDGRFLRGRGLYSSNQLGTVVPPRAGWVAQK